MTGSGHRAGLAPVSAEKLPDDRLGLQAIAEITGARLARVHKLRRSGGLPPEDGHRGGSPWWLRSTIDAWLSEEA